MLGRSAAAAHACARRASFDVHIVSHATRSASHDAAIEAAAWRRLPLAIALAVVGVLASVDQRRARAQLASDPQGQLPQRAGRAAHEGGDRAHRQRGAVHRRRASARRRARRSTRHPALRARARGARRATSPRRASASATRALRARWNNYVARLRSSSQLHDAAAHRRRCYFERCSRRSSRSRTAPTRSWPSTRTPWCARASRREQRARASSTR